MTIESTVEQPQQSRKCSHQYITGTQVVGKHTIENVPSNIRCILANRLSSLQREAEDDSSKQPCWMESTVGVPKLAIILRGIDLQGTTNYTMITKAQRNGTRQMVKMRNLFFLERLISMNILKDRNNYASITLQ
jgi:hypothetical protein